MEPQIAFRLGEAGRRVPFVPIPLCDTVYCYVNFQVFLLFEVMLVNGFVLSFAR
jgi:hypothetical protein